MHEAEDRRCQFRGFESSTTTGKTTSRCEKPAVEFGYCDFHVRAMMSAGKLPFKNEIRGGAQRRQQRRRRGQL